MVPGELRDNTAETGLQDNAAWQNCRVKLAMVRTGRSAAATPAAGRGSVSRGRAERTARAVPVSATVMLLLAVTACATPPGGNGTGAPGQTASGQLAAGQTAASAAAAAPSPASGTGTAAPTTKFIVEAVLKTVAGAGGQPQTGKIRTSLIDAGFPAGAVEVTASRTPTGLAAEAVEAAVRDGGDCIVAQIRNGGIAVSVLPALASGGCLVGAEG